MKKIILIFSILFLIVVTTFTKNSTKKLDNQIFSIRENISVLKDKYELVLLDYNFLTSPKKLLEYQSKYFETDLIPLDITQIKEIKEESNKLVITELSEMKKGNE
jgi:hypothetical protein|tara:strand:+ start:726 stop:1040 length:315 start_codon:yes stop_codon:yes gene_type:complete